MLNDLYYETIERAKNIATESEKNGKSVQPELIMLNAIGFAGLIRSGEPFDIEKPESEEVKKLSGAMSLLFEEVPEDKPQEYYICIKYKDEIYKCKDTDLRNVMHEDFDRLVLKIDNETNCENPSGAKSIDVSNLDLDLEFNEVTKPVPVSDEPAESQNEPNEPAVDPLFHLPKFDYDNTLPDDGDDKKHLSTFLCDEYDLVIEDKYGAENNMHIFIYPLNKADNALITDVFVIAENKGAVRAAISKGTTSAVNIDFGNISFIAKGSWKESEFNSQVNFTHTNIEAVGSPIHHRPTVHTSTTYVRKSLGGAVLYIFPGQFKDNNINGLCTSALVVDFGNDTNIYSPNQDGNFILAGEGDTSLVIDTYWTGDDFCFDMYESN